MTSPPSLPTRAVGIDAAEISRIRDARARFGAAFEEKILAPAEAALLVGAARPDEFVAGRFAAKEAVLKVLGTGWAKGISFRDVEVLRDEAGAPRVRLTGGAARRAAELGIGRIHVSITHAADLAMAVALGE